MNQADRRVWVEDLKATFFGDANLDGKVDAADLNDLGVNWLTTTATSRAQGDFNGDGSVLAGDLNAMGTNWQHGVAHAVAVPEPSGFILALGFSSLFGLRSSRRRRSPLD